MTHFPNADFPYARKRIMKNVVVIDRYCRRRAAIIGGWAFLGFLAGFSRYLFCNAADYLFCVFARQQIRLVKFAKSSVGRCPRPREAISSGSLC
jgi:hypothetical protein